MERQESNKKYYEKNKKRHQMLMAEYIECPCGLSVRRSYAPRHRKMKVHKMRMLIVEQKKVIENELKELKNLESKKSSEMQYTSE